MSEYLGYPQYIIAGFPKCGTKTMNKVFTELGYKVFDVMQMMDYAKQFNQFGKEEIEFAELAKIWEDNQYEVIIEPTALFWTFMVDHWPKAKLVHVVRDEISWKKSYINYMNVVCGTSEIQQTLEVVLYHNSHISPTVNEAAACMEGYSRTIVNLHGYFTESTFEEQTPWPKFITRQMRLFNADVVVNAPKDRTLFNYNVKQGWPKLRDFLGIKNDKTEFPHENKGANTQEFITNLFNETEYQKKYTEELSEYLKKFGIQTTK